MRLHVRGRGLPDEQPVDWWIVDGVLSAEPVADARDRLRRRLDRARACRRALPRRPRCARPGRQPRRVRRAGGDRTRGRRTSAARLRVADRHPRPRRPRRPAPDHPARSPSGAAEALPARLRDRVGRRVAIARRGRRAGAVGRRLGQAGRRLDRQGRRRPGAALVRRCAHRRRWRRPTPRVPGSPPTCSARRRCPA